MKKIMMFLILMFLCLEINIYAKVVIERTDIIEYGINSYGKNAIVASSQSPKTSGSVVLKVNQDEIKFLESTEKIPAIIGTKFGFIYEIQGEPKRKNIKVKNITIFPAEGLIDPKNNKKFAQSIFQNELKMNERHYRGYQFDEEWELVPGEWVFQIWYDDIKLVEKKFIVYKP